jgi:Yip1 domain/Protein of unknown function (DUF2680)
MDEPPQVFETQATAPPPPPMSLGARLLNVFATPGEVFEDVRRSTTTASNWLVPALVMGFIGVISAFIIFSQPAIVQQIHEQQQAMVDKSVKAGKMTQAQADQAVAAMEKFSGPSVMKITGSIAAVFASFVGVFWWALVLWLIGRVCFRVNLSYLKMAEVAGLASVIIALEVVVKMLLVVSLSNPMASPSLALLLKNPNPGTSTFTLLNFADIIAFWALAVRAIGLAKFTGVSFFRAAVWVFGAWLLMVGALTGIQATTQAVFGGMK